MVGRASASAGRLQDQAELVAHPGLTDHLVEGARAQRRLDGALVAVGVDGRQGLQVLLL